MSLKKALFLEVLVAFGGYPLNAFPDARCMVYLPIFGFILCKHVGNYTIHGAYGRL